MQLGGTWRSHLVWTDNIFLVARDAAASEGMMNDVTQALAERYLEWKASSLEWMHSVDELLIGTVTDSYHKVSWTRIESSPGS